MSVNVIEKQFFVFGRKYYIDSCGNLYSSTHRAMAKHLDKDGYEYTVLKSLDKKKKLLIHRLVAEAFMENHANLPQVNHKDGNKRNNRIDNLEWVTNAQNQYHSRYTLGNQSGFKDVPVICRETGKAYISTRDAWRKTGISYSHISECANGKRRTAGGYTWKRME